MNTNAGRFAFNFATGPAPSMLPPQREQLFALGVVIMSAKIAKVDGPVTRVEIDAFKRAFRIPPEAVRDIGLLFDEARDSTEDPVAFARQLGMAFRDQPGKLQDVLSALVAIAQADGPVNAAERGLLGQIATGFGLGQDAWSRAGPGTGEDPYATLGLSAAASPEEIRATWRRLVVEHHPDSVASRGATADAIAKATDKVAKINAAWDRIKRERGL
jgi:DnaJ like chaperone protein